MNVAEIEATFDAHWVTGPNGYPGGCDPTWAISWALRQTIREFPFLEDAGPVLAGYQWLMYTAQYDEDLARNDASHVKGK